MPSVTIRIDGPPVPQPRHRVTVRGGHGHAYLPKSHPVHEYKRKIRESWTGLVLEGPISVRLEIVLPRPSNMVWKKREMLRYRHIGRSDLDNFAKAFMDALNEVAWKDDGQIVELFVTKWVAAGHEVPHTKAEVIYGKDVDC